MFVLVCVLNTVFFKIHPYHFGYMWLVCVNYSAVFQLYYFYKDLTVIVEKLNMRK